MIGKLILFGATGDLAGRYLLPALASLLAAGRLPDEFQVIGAAREEWDDASFRRHALRRLEQHAADVPVAIRESLVGKLRYQPVDLDDPATAASAIDWVSHGDDQPFAAYLALPPAVYPSVVTALGAAGLPAGSRIVVEKPYGDDLASTTSLNALLRRMWGDDEAQIVFRVDHVLGMATAQNLLGLRFANQMLESVWNAAFVEQVDILWEENLALEGRASFYDRAGALRDVVQNHMLQMLCLVAMEPPASLSDRDLRDARLATLRSVRPLAPREILSRTQRGRYTAGRIGDRAVPSYVDEEGVDPARGTETFVEVVLYVDTPRWAGIPFVLRTGKALSRIRREAVLRFRRLQSLPFRTTSEFDGAGELRIGIDGPEEIVLRLAGSTAGPSPSLAPVTLAGSPPPSDLPAYGRVLLDVLSGGSALSVRADEAEEEWRIVTPILRAWGEGEAPMQEYPAGSEGPRRLDLPGQDDQQTS